MMKSPSDIPRYSEAAEQAVLGSILADAEALDKVQHLLKPEDFWLARHQAIYAAALAAKPVGFVQVSDRLRASGDLDDVGGFLYLSQLASSVPTTANVEAYAESVEFFSRVRGVQAALRQAAEDVAAAADDDALQIANLALGWAFRDGPGNPADLVHLGTAAEERLTYQRSRKRGSLAGHTWGFRQLDWMTGGLEPGALIIVAGRPSMGKSGMGLEVAKRSAKTTGLPWLVVSYEMSIASLADRQILSEGMIDGSRYRRAALTPEEDRQAGAAVERLKAVPLYGVDRQLALGEAGRYARHLRRRHNGIGGLLIDYVQLVKAERKRGQSRVEVVGEITQTAKQMAVELDCPVLALSQLSRAVESRDDKHPMLSDLRESGSLEQDADIVAFLYRDEYYNPQSSRKGICEVIVAKSRMDKLGTVELRFRPEWVRFDDLELRQESAGPVPGRRPYDG